MSFYSRTSHLVLHQRIWFQQQATTCSISRRFWSSSSSFGGALLYRRQSRISCASGSAQQKRIIMATSTTTTSKNDTEEKKTITEGSSHMCFHKDEETAVFYNPVQVQNRDLSVLMISMYAERRQAAEKLRLEKKAAKAAAAAAAGDDKTGKDPSQPADATSNVKVELNVLDALAASGLRSMRYWKECPNIRHITINDLDPAASDRTRTNIDSNGLSEYLIPRGNDATETGKRPPGIRIQTADATAVMYNSRESNRKRPAKNISGNSKHIDEDSLQWDVIDLDPYGSAAPFLDAAVQSICHGGLLNVTCTDMAALGGSNPSACFGRYSAMPLQRAGYLQEVAVRILLQSLATTAARYGRTIKPILSVGMDFYVRVFVEVYDDKAGVNNLSLQIGNVYQSTQCPSFYTVACGELGGARNNTFKPGRLQQDSCPETGSTFKIGGPIWLGPMHDRDVVAETMKRLVLKRTNTYPDMKWIATRERLHGLLTSCHEEIPDAPLYYKLSELCSTISIDQPPMDQIRNAFVNAGYSVSGFHKEPIAIKTNAPPKIVWDILRAWAKRRPPLKVPKEGSIAAKILAVEPSIEVIWSTPATAQAHHKQIKVKRFPQNPEANWGPKSKATGLKRKAEDNPK